MELIKIYSDKINESLLRLTACEGYIELYQSSGDNYHLDSAILQLRKAFESIAFAAISPNKIEYAKFREKAVQNKDYTKDFNAKAIFRDLAKVNPDFYPKPISAPIPVSPKNWHFERRIDSSISIKEFTNLYDRLGKYLHSENPWREKSNITELLTDIPDAIAETRLLLSWHFTKIKNSNFNGVLVVNAPADGTYPNCLTAFANGDFIIE